MTGKKRLLSLVAVMTVVSTVIIGVTLAILYDSAFEQQRARLLDTVKSQASLIAAVAQHEQDLIEEDPGHDHFETTLSQLREAYDKLDGLGKSGEFTLARREGDQIVFLLDLRHHDFENPEPVPISSPNAEPMRRALRGESGSVVGLDYRGEQVLAAYEPVEELGVGIVAKIDLTEIREPFIRTGFISAGIAIVFIFFGAMLSYRIANPMVAEIVERETQLLDITTTMPGCVYQFALHQDGSISMPFLSQGFKDLTGVAPSVLTEDATKLYDYIPAEDQATFKQYLAQSAETLSTWDREFRFVTPKLGTVWLIGRSNPRLLSDGTILWNGVLTSITERKRAEHLQHALFRISESANKTSDFKELLETIHEALSTLIDTTNFYIALYDAKNDMYSFPYCVDQYEEADFTPRQLRKSLTDYVRRSEKPIIVDEKTHKILADAGEVELIGQPSPIWLGVPLRAPTGIIGVVVLQSYSDPGAYSEADLDILSFVSDHIARAIERRRAEEAQTLLVHDMGERIKELTCMYGVAKVLRDWDSIEEVFRETVKLIPPAWQYPHLARARIVYEGVSFVSDGIVETEWMMSTDIPVAGQGSGVIEVFYTEEMPELDDGPFLDEERKLLDAVAATMGELIERQRVKQAKEGLQAQLVQSEKLASVGQLSAGVAHEINNPMGFISSNLGTMKKYLARIKGHLESNGGLDSDEQREIAEIVTDFGDAISESIEGSERVSKIVADLKGFTRADSHKMEATDLNAALESTLNIVWNQIKYNCKVEKDLGELPAVQCYRSQINQVLLNLLVNAGQAIGDGSGTIKLRTWADDRQCYVSVKDDGCGIAQEHLDKIFDPFFTTKDVGKGTGLGLSVSYEIVNTHGGRIDIDSVVGEGTEFIVSLPIESSRMTDQDAAVGMLEGQA